MVQNLRTVLLATVILSTIELAVHAQPMLVTEIPRRSTNLVTAGNFVYFTSSDSLLRTDGTAAGTVFLRRGFTSALTELTEFNGMLFFISGNQLWRSDGTTVGTIQLTTKSELDILSGIGTTLFFQGRDAATGLELYKTNGTSAGTALVRDINPGAGDGYLGNSAVVGTSFFFRANNGVNGHEPWKTDGTSAGTVMIEDINPGAGNGFGQGNVYSYNNLYYFAGNTTANGQEPWVSDGSGAGSFMLKDIAPGAEDPAWVRWGIGHDGAVYFITEPDPSGPNDEATAVLWKTTGTTVSTVSLSLLMLDYWGYESAGVLYDHFRIYNDKVYFFAQNSYRGSHQLWVSDGTPSGTHDVYDLDTEAGSGSSLVFFEVVNGYMLFYGFYDESTTYFYRSDGTTEGTAPWFYFNSAGFLAFPRDLTIVDDLLFYGDHTHEGDGFGGPGQPDEYFHLFQADGVTTKSMLDLYGVSTIGTQSIVDYNGKVIFSTQDDQSSSTDRQKYLWIYDPRPVPNEPPEPCAGAGVIRQEFWTNLPGTQVSAIPTATEADFTQDLTIFEGPAMSVGDNYGSRIRGFVCPPATGPYIFWIAGDDQVELSLSTDDDPANKRRIAYHTGWTGKRQWTKYSTQRSAVITLEANHRYYIEALMKERSGDDHVSVGWQLPDGSLQRPIAGTHLIPFTEEPPPACAGKGTILLETWTGINGTHVSSIPIDTPPDLTGERNIFEAPTNVGSNFGTRARGYVCAPATGNYTFWIASDDHGELWLSTDANPANKKRIASHKGWTSPRQWEKYTTQKSAPISLVAGQQYYIEALYKEDEGGDNMAVGWQLPDGTFERPIPASRLSPFEDAASTMAARTASEEEVYSQINLYPNPVKSGDLELTISGDENMETIDTQIQIITMTGEVVFDETIQGGGSRNLYLMKLKSKLMPGVYLVTLTTNGSRHLKRLLVN